MRDEESLVRRAQQRDQVRIAGHRVVQGRPLLYVTAKRFLEVFGFSRLEDLPTLREIEELVLPGMGADSEVEEAASAPAGLEGDATPAPTTPAPESQRDGAAVEGGSGELH